LRDTCVRTEHLHLAGSVHEGGEGKELAPLTSQERLGRLDQNTDQCREFVIAFQTGLPSVA
jgi:hypothetical protein